MFQLFLPLGLPVFETEDESLFTKGNNPGWSPLKSAFFMMLFQYCKVKCEGVL